MGKKIDTRREISIGLVPPRTLEGNIIYVQLYQLKQNGGEFSFLAEAESNIEFNSRAKSYLGHNYM